jgi:RimJ/RimL family protein N-acetyltransferase
MKTHKENSISAHYFLRGKKTGLRAMTREDLKLYQGWLNNKAVTEYLEMGWRPYTEQDLEDVYQEAIAGKSIVFVVCDLKSGQAIGTAGFYFIHWPGRRAQYRILLGEPSFYGKGYGTEVNALLLEYGFNRLNLNTIYLGVNAENKNAIKSYLNVGYKEEGRQRDFVYNNGRYYDSIAMSILAKDYNKKK